MKQRDMIMIQAALTATGGSSVRAVVHHVGGVQRTTQSVAGFSLVPANEDETHRVLIRTHSLLLNDCLC